MNSKIRVILIVMLIVIGGILVRGGIWADDPIATPTPVSLSYLPHVVQEWDMDTSIATPTSTPTSTPVATPTSTSTNTSTPTNTTTSTATATPTDTQEPPTASPTNSSTNTPTATPTSMPVPCGFVDTHENFPRIEGLSLFEVDNGIDIQWPISGTMEISHMLHSGYSYGTYSIQARIGPSGTLSVTHSTFNPSLSSAAGRYRVVIAHSEGQVHINYCNFKLWPNLVGDALMSNPYNEYGPTIDVGFNWWGYTDTIYIDLSIYDQLDNSYLTRAWYLPIATSPY